VLTKCGVPNFPKSRADRLREEEEENHSLNAETEAPLLKKKTTISVGGKEIAKKSKKQKKNNLTNEEKLAENPLARLGFGIVAYIDILWTLIVVFGIFSILLLPTLHYYQAGTGYKLVSNTTYETATLGNLGYSSVQCKSMPIEIGTLQMQCPYGVIGEVLDYGVNLNDATANNCASNDEINACRPDSTEFID